MSEFYENNQFTFEPASEEAAAAVRKPKKKRMGLKITAIALAAALVGGAAGAAMMGIFSRSPSDEPAPEKTTLSAPTEVTGQKTPEKSPEKTEAYPLLDTPLKENIKTKSGNKSMTPAEVYKQNVGAVVGIRTEITTNVFGQISSGACSGSGFVLTADGYVVTNYHVIEDATSIRVTLFDGTTYDAKLIGGYADNDVALLKVEAKNLQTVTIGKSDDIEVGEMVAAIGNPLGELTFTMTVGYISALDREINTDGTPINMLQSDVAINSGNSGGPLFDMNGNVIAITSAKYSGQTSSGAFIEGLSFCIPIDDVLDILFDLEAYGYVTGQPYLGITVRDLDASTAQVYRLPVGPYVNAVDEDSCAGKAGLQQGDIILALGQYQTENYNDLIAALKKFRAGQSTTIKIYRSGQELTLNITLDEKKEVAVTSTPTETPEQQETPQQQTPQQTPTLPGGGTYDDFYDFFRRYFGYGY